MHRILNYSCRREMVICSAWRIEHHCAQTVMFQPTWEASMHHHTNGFWILASKSLFTLQLTTTTQASIAEIQACQCQKLLSISLPTMRAGQQWQWKLKLDPQSTETRATFSGETHLATEPSWSLDEIFDPNNFNFNDFSEVGSSRISSQ